MDRTAESRRVARDRGYSRTIVSMLPVRAARAPSRWPVGSRRHRVRWSTPSSRATARRCGRYRAARERQRRRARRHDGAALGRPGQRLPTAQLLLRAGRQRQGRQPLRHHAADARRAERQSGDHRRCSSRPAPMPNGATPEGETVLMTAARTGNADVDQARSSRTAPRSTRRSSGRGRRR